MFWPGMGDPAKRKKTLRFLAISLAVGIAVVLASTTVISQIKDKDPLYHKCLNGLDVQYHVSATLEVQVDGKKWVKPDIADTQKDCERTNIPKKIIDLFKKRYISFCETHGRKSINPTNIEKNEPKNQGIVLTASDKITHHKTFINT